MKVRITGGALTDRARVVLRHGLSLDDPEVEALFEALPFEATLAESTDAQRARLQTGLRSAGITAEVANAAVSFAVCPKHARLSNDQSCPRCGERTCAACRGLHIAGVCPSCSAKLRRRRLFRNLRISALVSVFTIVLLSSYADRRAVRDWTTSLSVVVHPMALDLDEETKRHVASVTTETYAPVATFLENEARRFEIETSPLIEFTLGDTLSEPPPIVPEDPTTINAIIYSLRLRWYAFNLDSDGDVRLFVLYHRPEVGKALPHSIGIEQGHVGVVHVYAGDKHEPANLVVVAHELLHTAGATDKYGADGMPFFPSGYADPGQPVQTRAELMAGAIPDAGRARPAAHLGECIVGPKTADEIAWAQDPPTE